MKTLLTINEVSEMLGLSKTTIERMRRHSDTNFPPAIRISEKCIRFDRSDILSWIEKRKELGCTVSPVKTIKAGE